MTTGYRESLPLQMQPLLGYGGMSRTSSIEKNRSGQPTILGTTELNDPTYTR